MFGGMYATVVPNFWAGLLVVVMTIMGSIAALVVLFNWDDPQRTREDRDRDKTRGFLG